MIRCWQLVAEFPNGETVVLSNYQYHVDAVEALQDILGGNVGWHMKRDTEYINLSQATRLKIIEGWIEPL